VSSTRDATATFEGYMRGLFQPERTNMLRMSEVNEVDHQSMQHMLTEGCVDWQGFGRQIAQEANELLGGTDAVLIFDESGFAKKGEASAGVTSACGPHSILIFPSNVSATSALISRFLRPGSLPPFG